MHQKRKLPNFKDRCRICLDRDACMTDLFSDGVHPLIINLEKCTNFKIHEDGVSRNVCHVCLYKMELWKELVSIFNKSNSKLDLYNKDNTVISGTILNHQNSIEDGVLDKISMDIDKKKQKLSNEVNNVEFKETTKDVHSGTNCLPEKNAQSSDSLLSHGLMIVPAETQSPQLESLVKISTVMNMDRSDTTPIEDIVMTEPLVNNIEGLTGKSSPLRKLSSKKEALTKRWEERKKALVAASGEKLTESDSSNDEFLQLSPIRKARILNNVDKDSEKFKHKPVRKNDIFGLPNNNHKINNLSEPTLHENSIKRKVKLKNSINDKKLAETIEAIRKDWSDESMKDPKDSEKFGDPPPLTPAPVMTQKAETEKIENSQESHIEPQYVESRVMIGKTMYIVSSVLDEPDELDKLDSIPENLHVGQANNNTAIIDALELQRVDLKKESDPNVTNCLKIEVEGMELEALKKIQADLENYVSDLDYEKLFQNGSSENILLDDNPMNESLDYQLKYIVKTVLQKNCDMDSQSTLKKSSPLKSPPMVNNTNKPGSGRRKHIMPKRYKDFEIETPPPLKTPKKIVSPVAELRQISPRNNSKICIVNESEEDSDCTAVFDLTQAPKPSKTPPKLTPKPTLSTPRQRHICGLCGIELFSKEDAEAHVKSHKVKEPEQNSNAPALKAKPKLMRCKRCQAVVESQHVKQHVCFTATYPCKTCDLNFGSEKLLEDHSLLHSKSQKSKKPSPPTQLPTPPTPPSTLRSPEKNFTCFLCDKKISGEESMKEHLQCHCNAETPEQNSSFQCAICGEKCENEESLERHVIEHLEDENPESAEVNSELSNNLMNYPCPQCSEIFDSSLLLAMHLTTHQEEEEDEEEEEGDPDNKVGEYEDDAYVCTICDEIFDTQEELSSHTDLHKGKTHVCILCEKSFVSILDLREHVSSHLSQKK